MRRSLNSQTWEFMTRHGGRKQKDTLSCASVRAFGIGSHFTSPESPLPACGQPAHCRTEQRFYSFAEGALWFESGHRSGGARCEVSWGPERILLPASGLSFSLSPSEMLEALAFG